MWRHMQWYVKWHREVVLLSDHSYASQVPAAKLEWDIKQKGNQYTLHDQASYGFGALWDIQTEYFIVSVGSKQLLVCFAQFNIIWSMKGAEVVYTSEGLDAPLVSLFINYFFMTRRRVSRGPCGSASVAETLTLCFFSVRSGSVAGAYGRSST